MSTNLRPTVKFLQLILLCGGLCGCASTKPILSEADQNRDPNSATIYVHRKSSITGGFSADHWIDWGDGAVRNAVVMQYATDPYNLALRGYIPPLQDLEPIKRAKVRSATWVDFFAIGTNEGREYVRFPEGHMLSLPSTIHWQPNACYVGKLGPGGTLVWRRPPGTLDMDFMRAAELVRTPVSLAVKAGKTYHIYYTMGLKFTIKEGP